MASEPKLTPIQVPAVRDVEGARLARWNKRVGEVVVANETLAVVEGEQGALELPSPASGVLVRVDRLAGDRVLPGDVVGALEVMPNATRVLQVAPESLAPRAPNPPVPAAPMSFAPPPAPIPAPVPLVTPAPPAAPSVPESARVPSSATPITLHHPVGADAPQGRALARRLAGFGTTIFTEMTQLALQHGAINLAQGFPDFDGPEFIKQAAIDAIRAGHGQYAPMAGLRELHQALSAKYEREHGLRYAPGEEITVTAGATEAIFAALQGLCDVGDEVILFEPYYDSYRASVCMAGATPRVVTLRTPDWRFDPDELKRAFNARTRAVVLNTPHNPTGKVFAREELEVIGRLCVEHDVVCLADEVYEHLVYEGRHVPMATLPGMRERTLTISSLGKTYSLTGWKIGWACGPRVLTQALRTAHQFVTFAVALPLQHGAVAAINAPPSFYSELQAEYRARRDLLADGLTRAGLGVRMPQGAYFICADIRALGHFDDVRFCRELIEKIGVAAIPPSVFYDRSTEGKTYVRFAFCKREETLRAAVERLARLGI